MRITSGELKGRKLLVPKDSAFRPTSEKVREAIFSTLPSLVQLEGAHVLDLYSGSGALGVEAISRGALTVDFVEKDRALTSALKKNLETLELTDRCHVISGDVLQALKRLSGSYTVVFADPPYEEGNIEELAAALLASKVISPQTVLVFETSRQSASAQTPQAVKGVELLREKRYGDTLVHYFKFLL